MHFRISEPSDSHSIERTTGNRGRGRLCSYCGKSIELSTAPLPFCSVRCQQLDLANWLDEEYGLPWDGENDEATEPTEQ